MSRIKLKSIIREAFGEDDDGLKRLSADEKSQVLEMIRGYNSMGKSLNRDGSLPEIADKLSKIADSAQSIVLGEKGDWFDGTTKKKNMGELSKSSKEFNKIAQEAYNLEQRMTALYEDMGHVLGRYFDIDEEINDGNIEIGADVSTNQTNDNVQI
jgi:hypothetical protein